MRWFLVMLVACSSGPAKGPVEALRDRMCACKDRACGDAVEKELRALQVEVTDEVAAQLAAAAACSATLSAP